MSRGLQTTSSQSFDYSRVQVMKLNSFALSHFVPILDVAPILDICLLLPLICMQKCKFPLKKQHKHDAGGEFILIIQY